MPPSRSMRSVLLLVWVEVLHQTWAESAKECFAVPRGADYAPVLSPTSITWRKGDEEVAADVSLRPLFDKTSTDPSNVTFYSDARGALKVLYDLPRSLPLLGTLRLAGSGSFVLSIEDRYEGSHYTYHEILQGAKEFLVYDSPQEPVEARSVSIMGQELGCYLTALRFLASGRTIDDSSYDGDGEEDKGPSGGAAEDVLDANVTGCACVGWPKSGGKGSACGQWDGDCPGSGWCYTKPKACEYSYPSSSFSNVEWSCQPCGGNTTIPISPSPKPTVPELDKSKQTSVEEECNCTGPMVLSLFGGIAIGVVLAVAGLVMRPRPVRRLQRAAIEEEDDELGHHD